MHRWCIGPAWLLGANPTHRSAPEGPFPRDLVTQRWGWGPRAQVPDSPCCPSATQAARGPPVNQDRRTGRDLRAPADLRSSSAQKPWLPCSCSQRPHLGPPLRLIQSRWIGPAKLLGLTKTLGRPRGAHPKGPGSATLGIGDSEPQNRTHPAALSPPGPLGAPPVIQGGRTDRALEKPVTLEASRQNAGAHALARQSLYLGPRTSRRPARGLGLPPPGC